MTERTQTFVRKSLRIKKCLDLKKAIFAKRTQTFLRAKCTEYSPAKLGVLPPLLFNRSMKTLFTILTLVGLAGQTLGQVQSPAEQSPKAEGRNPTAEAAWPT